MTPSKTAFPWGARWSALGIDLDARTFPPVQLAETPVYPSSADLAESQRVTENLARNVAMRGNPSKTGGDRLDSILDDLMPDDLEPFSWSRRPALAPDNFRRRKGRGSCFSLAPACHHPTAGEEATRERWFSSKRMWIDREEVPVAGVEIERQAIPVEGNRHISSKTDLDFPHVGPGR